MFRININKVGCTMINSIATLQDAESIISTMNIKQYNLKAGNVLDIIDNETNLTCKQITV